MRSPQTHCIELLNLGPACCDDLARIDVLTLADLRELGALRVFEEIMIDRLHRKINRNLFHAMYLYALWGALQNHNCMKLSGPIRNALKQQAVDLRSEILG